MMETMATNRRSIAGVIGLALVTVCAAQSPESWQALRSQPRATSAPVLQRSVDLNEYFIYLYQPQTLPIVDDFSVDRTRHLNASSSDANVTLIETIYTLEVGGVSTADMAFQSNTTFLYTTDTVGTDTTVITANTPISVTLTDISVYPVTDTIVLMWPAYSVYDTVGNATTDTVYLPLPNVFQDSLFVYEVAAQTTTYTNPDNSLKPLILWEEDEAFINGTYPIDPPTIGVASFDGMDRTGFPYAPENPNFQGIADHLTSVPINLTGVAGDSVYLSFFFQPRGLSGDLEFDASDSLRLEYYAPQLDQWSVVWSTPYLDGDQPFTQVMLPIVFDQYLKDGFRMRFSNRATLGGPVDHWHIDYVRLAKQRSITDIALQDKSYVYPASTLLSQYTSVPFAKFTADPGAYMAQSVDLALNNLSDDALITWGYRVDTDCGSSSVFPAEGLNPGSNANSTFTTSYDINSGANNYQYDLSGCADAAFATTKFWTTANNTNIIAYNDTNTVVQQISNYYSYDDGSAEQSYSFNGNCVGCRLAYRFDGQGPDSLRAIRVYFDPIFSYSDIFNDPRNGSFLVTVWSADLNADPVFQNVTFSSPEYRQWGPNYFVEYPLDSTIAVNGTFHVGWVQTNSTKVHLGLDRNTTNNNTRMFYNTGASWEQSEAPGSWMIRPVMQSAVDPYAGVPEQDVNASMMIFPNPASDELRIKTTDGTVRSIEILDATGRLALSAPHSEGSVVQLSILSPGIYLVRALDGTGRALAQQRLIVQR